MKQLFNTISISIVASLLLSSCSQGQRAENLPGISKELQDSVSYAVGASLGSMVMQADLGQLNMKELYKAIEDVLLEKDLKIETAYINDIINRYMAKRQDALAQKSAAEAKAFFDENRKKEGVQELESGLQYKILAEGNGIKPAAEDTIEVHYKGTLIDGTQFDSSYDRDETATLALNHFIPGWVEGMQYASEGGKIELYIPAELAYGNQAMGVIKPGSTLIFEVELLKVKKATESKE